MFTFNVDKGLSKLGFVKVHENKRFIVQYERCVRNGDEQLFVQCLEITHGVNGNHTIHTYQRGINSDGFNNSVCLTEKETALALRKLRQMRWK